MPGSEHEVIFPGRKGSEPAETPSVEYPADLIPLQELAAAARRVVEGNLPQNLSHAEKAIYVNDWLRWSQSDSPSARRQWYYLVQTGQLDRDQYVLDLWRSINEGNAPNRFLKGEVREQLSDWDFYQRHFFGWFLSRFDLRAARQVFASSRHASGLPYVLGVLIVVLVPGMLRLWSISLQSSLSIMVVVLALFLFGWWKSVLPWFAYLFSFLPRMAAAVGIGYLFLISVPQLVKLILEEGDWQVQLGISSLLLIASLAYVMLHISRRVFPPISVRELIRRSLEVIWLAVTYATAELLAVVPFLFRPTFLGGAPAQEPGLGHMVLCAAIALNLGVILQLAWDEKPLTEPL